MKLNVVKNAKRNLVWGLFFKVVQLLFPFIERVIIRLVMGSLYLGLNSLFSSILSVLSIAELGFGSAIVFNMYKPIAENDIPKVNRLLNFYRQSYRIIGITVLVIGSLLIPFLPYLINGDYPHEINLTVVYLIFLLNSVISYFISAYLSSLLVTHQRDDIQSKVSTIVAICMNLMKIFMLVQFKNYYYAILMLPVFSIVQNVVIAVCVKKMYPQYRCEGKLEKEELDPIKKLIAGTFVTRACAVTRNSLDSICISAFLGLSLTAIYNNYYTISHSITIVLGIVSTAFIGGIGNHVVTKSIQENFEELEELDCAYMLLSGWCTAFLLCLYQPFMQLWMGKDMLLPMHSVVLFCLYFYALKIGDMRAMYSTANGLWWHHRARAVVETIANFVLNIMMGKLFGVNGIILATVISLFLCNMLWATSITFRLYFKEKRYLKQYYVYQLKYAILNLAVCALSFGACSLISMKSTMLQLIVSFFICIFIPALFYGILYTRSQVLRKSIHRVLPKRRLAK